MTGRKSLACPECFGASPRSCERCNGTGFISVVVPDGGVSDEMLPLMKQERELPIGGILSAIYFGVAVSAIAAAVIIAITRPFQ